MNRVQATSFFSRLMPKMPEQRHRKWVAATLVITLIAIPIIYSSISTPCSVSNNLNIFKAKDQENRGFCQNFVESITDMDNVPIQELTELAQEKGIYGNRVLKDKLFQDCMSVRKMGTTKEELANHLKAISIRWVDLDYNPALQGDSTIGQCSQTQSLQTHNFAAACCASASTNIFNEVVYSCIYCDYFRKNPTNNVGIYFSDKIIERIRIYGFYDGFDPVDIAALLTGHSLDAIRQAIGIGSQHAEINKCLSSIIVGEVSR